jgi:hypothetical protein
MRRDSKLTSDLVTWLEPRTYPLVDAAIPVIFSLLNCSAYLRVEAEYEPPSPDGETELALNIASAIGRDKDELRKRDSDLGEIDGSIKKALPRVLVGPGVWELSD